MQRRILALITAALVSACTTQLERGLSEASADEIVVALGEHGIGATKEAERGGDGFDVLVLQSDVAASLAVLRDEGLPREHAPSIAEAFAEPSLIPTAGEERARLTAALSADLERTIEGLAGVHSARVHLGLPDPSVVPLDEQLEERSASVLVTRRAESTIDEAAIRALVAGAVPGLAEEDVRVVAIEHVASPPSVPLVPVLGITVAEGSVTTLRVMIAGLLCVIGLLAAGLFTAVARSRALRVGRDRAPLR